MVSLGTRLREERERVGLTQSRLSILGEVSQNTQWLFEMDRRPPKADYLSAIAGTGIDINYVVTGVRCGRADDVAASALEEQPSAHSAAPPGDDYIAIPIYDLEAAIDSAGRLFDAEAIIRTVYLETAYLADEGVDPDKVIGARVRGDAMGETLRDGEQVLIDRSQTRPDGIFLVRIGAELHLRRIQRLVDGSLMLISDNTRYRPEVIKPQDMREVEVLGRCGLRVGLVVNG